MKKRSEEANEKLLQEKKYASHAFYGLQGKLYYIIPNVTQFFIRVSHVYRETMKHKKYIHAKGKLLRLRHFLPS
jgi:predicted glycosyltransferase involved in capsule biosynthesis